MKDEKKHPMTLTRAAHLLLEEHPEIAYTAKQLRNLCNRGAIERIEEPACGVERKIRHTIYYPDLVRTLKSWKRPAIS